MLIVDHDHEAKGCNGSVEGQRKKHFGAILLESLTGPEHTIPEPVPKNVSFHVYRPSPSSTYSSVPLVNEKKKIETNFTCKRMYNTLSI